MTETDADLETGRPDELFDEVGGRGADAGLDAGDRRLRNAGPAAQVGLGEPGPLARLADEIAENHPPVIADWLCWRNRAKSRPVRKRNRRDVAAGPAALERHRPSPGGAVAKLNDAFSGEGNARFRFRRSDAGPGAEARIARRLPTHLRSLSLLTPQMRHDRLGEQAGPIRRLRVLAAG